MLSELFIGKKVRLTALTPDDMPTITHWYHDSDFQRLFDSSPAQPKPQYQWEKWLKDGQSESNIYMFGIRPIYNDDLIGYLEIDGIQWSNRTCGIAIGIGDVAQRGKGYGKEALQLALNYIFNELNLYRVQLTVFSYNESAIHLYEKLGFTHEGTFREHLQRDGKRYDMLLYGMLAHEWEPDEA